MCLKWTPIRVLSLQRLAMALNNNYTLPSNDMSKTIWPQAVKTKKYIKYFIISYFLYRNLLPWSNFPFSLHTDLCLHKSL